MILKQKDKFDPKLKQQLKDYVYDIVGYIYDVLKELPCGMPEYLYQEGFAKVLRLHNIDPHKEYQHHPVFMGEPMESYLKMDFMVERELGNIVVEAKAIEKLTGHERSQLFSYLIGTGFPIGILVNFATYPKPQIEKYYFDKREMTITAF